LPAAGEKQLKIQGFGAFAVLAFLLAAAPSAAQQATTGNWNSNCSAPDLASPLACAMEQRVILRESGQQIARFTVQTSGTKDDRKAAYLVQVPLGLSIRTGVRLKVDEREPVSLDIQTCEASGCYAGGPLAGPLLDGLKGGKMLTLLFNDLQKKEIGIQIDLTGFAAQFEKIR
jgi:invasion protein IalB